MSSRDCAQRRFSDSRRTRIGLAFIAIGGFGVLVFVAGHGSYAFALALWAVAGTGMGLTSNSLSTALLQLSPPEAVGRHQSAVTSRPPAPPESWPRDSVPPPAVPQSHSPRRGRARSSASSRPGLCSH